MRFANGSSLLRHSLIRQGFIQAWRAVAPEDDVRNVFHTLELRLNDLAQELDELALTIPVACFVAYKDERP